MIILHILPPLLALPTLVLLGLFDLVAINRLIVLSLPPQQSLTKLLRIEPVEGQCLRVLKKKGAEALLNRRTTAQKKHSSTGAFLLQKKASQKNN